MYTRENWNPNVYNINIDYKNIPTNRRAVITDEVQEISNLALPVSQKSYVQYKTQSLTKNENTLKINNQYQFINLEEKETINLEDIKTTTTFINTFTKEETEQYTYTLPINLNNTKFVKITTNHNQTINTQLTKYTIIQNNTTYNAKLENKIPEKTTIQSNGEPIKIHFINLKNIIQLKLETNNPEYFNKLIKYG